MTQPAANPLSASEPWSLVADGCAEFWDNVVKGIRPDSTRTARRTTFEHHMRRTMARERTACASLAELYGVPTKRFNEQVRSNLEWLPEEFMFHLTNQDLNVLRSQFVTSSSDAWLGVGVK